MFGFLVHKCTNGLRSSITTSYSKEPSGTERNVVAISKLPSNSISEMSRCANEFILMVYNTNLNIC